MAKILIIEDQSALRRLYQTVLGRGGHEVVLAQSGEAGIVAAALEKPDLVIMDLMLPGISGQQATSKLRETGTFPGTPLIITTALNDDHARSVADSLGAASVLLKPFDIYRMLSTVDKALLDSGSSSPGPKKFRRESSPGTLGQTPGTR